MNNATESAAQAPPAPAAERAAPKESQRLDWLIVGLDVPDLEQARPLVQALAGRVGALKIGPVLFTRAGAGGHRPGARARRPGVPRPEMARHSQHRGRGLPRGGGAGRVDGQRARGWRRAHAGRRARGPGARPGNPAPRPPCSSP